MFRLYCMLINSKYFIPHLNSRKSCFIYNLLYNVLYKITKSRFLYKKIMNSNIK